MAHPLHFGSTHGDYLVYRPPFAPKLYERLRAYGIGLPRQSILDLGAGTGIFSKPLIDQGSIVAAVDVSPELIEHAAGHRIVAMVESLPFADSSFDVVTASQCWHWFDRRSLPKEVLRVLKPQGTLAVIYQTYIPLPGSVAEKTEQLILKYQPRWRHANSTGINGQVLRDVQIGGFCEIESFSFDIGIDFSREAWAGLVRTLSAVGASMPAETLRAFETEHADLLQDFPAVVTIPHRVFAVVTKRP